MVRNCLVVALILLCTSRLIAGEPVPVLCFHSFSDESPTTQGKLTETYHQFEDLLKFLSEQEYVSCFPDEVPSGVCRSVRRVIMTFDDGTKEQLRAAALLEQYKFKGIFFVVPARIATESERYLTADELRMLAGKGNRIAVHGFNHKTMPGSPEEVRGSSQQSVAILREVVGPDHPFVDFAFPFGHFDAETAGTMDKTFRYLHTVNPGYWDGSSALVPRMLLTTDKDLSFFKEYIVQAPHFRPILALVSLEGGVSDVVEFSTTGVYSFEHAELMSVSMDMDGQLYAFHPLGTLVSKEGYRVFIDLKRHMKKYYSPERRVISGAIVVRAHDQIRYLSSGHTLWISE